MKVAPSGWNRCETSVSFKKSRKKEAKLPVEISFVGHRRSKSSKRGPSTLIDVQPAFCLTTEHRIMAFGKAIASNEALQESQIVSYTGRPTRSGAWLAPEPAIPAVVDLRGDAVFCFQGSNKVVSCWSVQNAPDQAIQVTLEAPAHHAAVIPSESLLYGTLENGSLYLVQANGGENLYLEQLTLPDVPKDATPLGTHAHLITASSGKKRKHHESLEVVQFYQLFVVSRGILVILQEVTGLQDGVLSASVARVRTTLVGWKDYERSKMRLLGVINGLEAVLCCENSSGDPYICSLSLEQARLLSGPLAAPADTREVQMVGANHLLFATNDSIFIATRSSGGLVGSIALDEAMPNRSDAELWRVFAYPKKHRIVVVYVSDGKLHLSSCVLDMDNAARPSLAASLASAMETPAGAFHGLKVTEIATRSDSWTTSIPLNKSSVHTFDMAVVSVRTSQRNANKPGFLLNSYQEALRQMAASPSSQADSTVNPQDAQKSKKSNGLKNGSAKPAQGDAAPPKVASEAFAEHVFDECSAILLESKLHQNTRYDSLVIIQSLVKSKRISVRLLRGLDLVALLHAADEVSMLVNTSYASIRLVIDMLEKLKDLPEQYLALLLHFALSHAPASAVAAHIDQSKSFDPRNRVKRQANEFLTFEHQDKHDEATLETLSTQLINGFARLCLSKVLGHSRPNESLLRNAINATMSRSERLILLQLLKQNFCAKTQNTTISRTMTWMSCLCDTLEERDSTIKALQESIQMESLRTESMLALRAPLGEAVSKIDKQTTPSKKAARITVSTSHQPGYQIERLVF